MLYRDFDYDENSYIEVLAEFDGEYPQGGPYRVQKYVYRQGWYTIDKSFATEEAATQYAMKRANKTEGRYRVVINEKGQS